MLAMALLMVDFFAMPVLACALVGLLVWYGRDWHAWRRSMREGD